MPEQGRVRDIYLRIRSNLARDVVVRRLVPPHEVEDIVQETYVRLCQVKNEEDIRSPRTYLVKMVRNLALDYAKRASTRLNVSAENDEEFASLLSQPQRDETYSKVVSDEEFGRFCESARLLPVQCRRVFVLKKVYGYSQREIAEELGISQSAVEKQVAIAIKRCTSFMLEQQVGEKSGKASPAMQSSGGYQDE
jgi:RNA polymerase sigma factor (sigma-70 family)